MSSFESDKFHSGFAGSGYLSNCPLQITENIYWKQFFFSWFALHKKVPSQYEFWNWFSDKNFQYEQHANLDKNTKSLCLAGITDSWSSVTNERIVSFVNLTQNVQSGQFDSIESDQNKKGGMR